MHLHHSHADCARICPYLQPAHWEASFISLKRLAIVLS